MEEEEEEAANREGNDHRTDGRRKLSPSSFVVVVIECVLLPSFFFSFSFCFSSLYRLYNRNILAAATIKDTERTARRGKREGGGGGRPLASSSPRLTDGRARELATAENQN